MAGLKIAGLLMAAGRGLRFGANKLEVVMEDRLLGLHAAEVLAKVATSGLFAVCNQQSTKLRSGLKALGYHVISNDAPEAGLSHSLRLGLAALGSADAALLCLADMPFITAAHLRQVILASEGCTVAVTSAAAGQSMPPALLPRSLLPKLDGLEGDSGARSLLTGAKLVQVPQKLLADIDLPGDLRC